MSAIIPQFLYYYFRPVSKFPRSAENTLVLQKDVEPPVTGTVHLHRLFGQQNGTRGSPNSEHELKRGIRVEVHRLRFRVPATKKRGN